MRKRDQVHLPGRVINLPANADAGVSLATSDAVDDARLQQLAERFYDRASAEHSRLPTSLNMEREFWTRLFLEFGRAVQRDTRDAGASILTQISNLAMQHYERLPPRDKVFGIGRVLHAITELAKQPL